VVTNIMANGESVGAGYGAYVVDDGANVVIYYAAAPGYKLKAGYDGVVPIGIVKRDTTVDETTPGIPEAEALGRYLVGTTIYSSFASMNAALKDGDTVTMLMDDRLPSGTALSKAVAFVVGGYVLSAAPDDDLTINADVVFTAKAAANLPPMYVRTDCTLTLPARTAFDDYSLLGEDYAYVVIGGNGWVRYEGRWQKMDLVAMNFYDPGYFDIVETILYGLFGARIEDDRLESFTNRVATKADVQKFYYDPWTETYIDEVYWFDGTWRNADDKPIDFPTRYVAGEFYPHSTAIVFKIAYDMRGVAGATHANPTGYSIESSRIDLGAASAPNRTFLGWTDAEEAGVAVTEIDPIAIGRDAGFLYDLTLYANWGPATSAPLKLKTAATIMPGEPAAYYDTPEQAQAAAAAVNANRAGCVLAPAGFTGGMAGYADNFTAVANGTTMAIRMTDEAKADLAVRVGGDTLSLAADLADPAVKMVTVRDAEPGFYYSVVGGTSLDGITEEGSRELAQESTVELEKPDLGHTDKAFYKVRATVK